jgi:hypothetical protein
MAARVHLRWTLPAHTPLRRVPRPSRLRSGDSSVFSSSLYSDLPLISEYERGAISVDSVDEVEEVLAIMVTVVCFWFLAAMASAARPSPFVMAWVIGAPRGMMG